MPTEEDGYLTRVSRVGYLAVGLSFILLYPIAVWLLRGHPFAQSLFGNASLILSAAVVPLVVLRRRHSWSGCQRFFWDVIAVGMILWIVGHFGWAYHQVVLREQSWLQWHTLFSLSAGIAPLMALLARPHQGPRRAVVGSVAMTVAGYCLLAVFVYSYFVLLPSLIPEARPGAQERLLYFVQANRLFLLIGLAVGYWFARATAWRSTYLTLAVGVAIGLLLRIGTNQAISRGEYQVGSFYDLAWITPWLFYAWAAAEAPVSPEPTYQIDEPREAWSVSLLVVPALLIPLIGYGVLNIESVGEPVDSFRLFLTSLTTVAALGFVTLRLAGQGGELERADARLRLLAGAMEHTGDLILITRPDGTFEHANAAFLRAFGYTRAELTSLNFVDLIEPGMTHVRRDIPAEVRARGVWRGMLRGLRKDGTTFPTACTVTALQDPSGRFTHFVGIERDITEDLQLRDQLVHSERLSAIGELIAGVAHEINNPLQTIIGCTELMLDEPQGANTNDLEVVRKEAMRAGQIVRNLLAFARRGAPDRVVVDLNELVQATAELREYHLQQVNIELTLRCAPRPLPVLVNREEIRQVVLNLLLNAEHAITDSGANAGSITVETSGAGGSQTVEVTDSGPGISPELRGRVFEPFFTTREVGEGTGLGLSISLGIVSSHGGTLTLVDSPKGARFLLSLPAHAEAFALPETGGNGGPQRALVVDDDEAIRKLIVKLLERRGFDVSEAQTGESALNLAREQRPGIVICAASLPGTTGLDLYRQLVPNGAQHAPRFLLISGDQASGEIAASGVPVLVKPFTATDLEGALVEAGVAAPRS
jgi:PAS domain S-box-containing protein